MESSLIIWRWLLMLSLVVFTQLLGVLLYFMLARLPKWLAHGLSILGTGLAFFYLAPILLFAGVREAQLRGPVGCGMPALAAAFLVLIGTGFQLFVAAGIHIWLVRKGRTANVPAS
jgi:hypothetical protein